MQMLRRQVVWPSRLPARAFKLHDAVCKYGERDGHDHANEESCGAAAASKDLSCADVAQPHILKEDT
jgi:hypothetical protein